MLIILLPLRFYVKSNLSEFNFAMSFLAISEVLNFDFGKFEQLSIPKFIKIQTSEPLKLVKIIFLDYFNLAKI